MMMNDPMANLTGAPPPGAEGPGADGSLGGPNTKEVFDPLVMNINMQRIDRIHAMMGIVSGCVAGIIGLSGLLEGLVCFCILHMIVSLSIWVCKMNCSLSSYTKKSWIGYLTLSLQPTLLSFTLFWTLFYGLVYLY